MGKVVDGGAAAAVGAGRAGGDVVVVFATACAAGARVVVLLGDGVEAALCCLAEAESLQLHDVECLRRGRLVGGEAEDGTGRRGWGYDRWVSCCLISCSDGEEVLRLLAAADRKSVV